MMIFFDKSGRCSMGMGCIMLHPDPLKLDDYFGIAWHAEDDLGVFPMGHPLFGESIENM